MKGTFKHSDGQLTVNYEIPEIEECFLFGRQLKW